MKKPTYSKLIDLLDILGAYTGGVGSVFHTPDRPRYTDTVASVWGKLITYDNHPSSVWCPMVQEWVNAGVCGSHVYIALRGTSVSLNMLIEKPEEFVTRCILRGHNVRNIVYPWRLDDGPAWEAVKESHRVWQATSFGTVC